ncbi:MAG: hypothetical protein C4527_02415 [Candidatus Omnitrophota bacterium]|jgi:hypothetical protein|nr:MAG: hypothetical protein C4527_02415 [Candidatus Omnitrophota bacterium]
MPRKTDGQFLPGFFFLFLIGMTTVSAQPDTPDASESAKLQNLEITVSTEGPLPAVVRAGAPFAWKIVVRWYGDLEALVPRVQKQPTFEGAKLLASSTTLKTGSDPDRRYAETIFTYRLLAETQGELTIGAAAIGYRAEANREADETFLTTNRVVVEVLPAPFSLTKFMAKLWDNRFLRISFVLLIILTVFGVTLFRIIRSRKMTSLPPVADEKKPSQAAFESAHRARIEGDIRGYVRLLEQAVRLSLEELFPQEQSKNPAAFRHRIQADLHPVFDRFFTFCEETKFAPIHPSPDVLDQVWNDAKRLTGVL